MRYCVKRVLCLLMSLALLLALSAVFTLSPTASIPSKTPMIAIGNNFMVVQTASGEIWGWGDNSTGVLGSEQMGGSITSPTKITLPKNVTSVSVSAGYDHVLMLGSDGNVYAWGDNAAGQLGADTGDMLTTPTLVEGLRGKNIVAVSAGKQFSLALTDGGKVYSFGLNDKLQLGYELEDSFATSSSTPTLIADLATSVFVKQICAGEASVITIDVNGKVYLWGDTQNYVLGTENNSTDSVLPFSLSDIKTVPSITASDLSINHSAFLLEGGKVAFMGFNKYGQYGNNPDTLPSRGAPALKQVDTSALNVTTLAAADTQTVLLTVDGKVYTAGTRNPNDTGSASITFVPLFGEGVSAPAAVAIAAGYRNGAMIAQDGSIWTWGDNSCGQLGNGSTNEGQTTPAKVFVASDSDFDMGQAPTVMGVPIKFTASVPAPTYSVKIPATIDVGELRQTSEDSEDRYSLTKFTVAAENVDNLFGEKEVQVSVASGDANGIFVLRDGNGGILPFELFAEEGAQTIINSGDIFAHFAANGSVDTWIRIDQSKITQSGIYNGVLIFSYSVEDIGN